MQHLFRERLARERGAKTPTGSFRIALLYPSPYPVALSSLGYQVIQRLFNEHPDVACERVVLPDAAAVRRSGVAATTLESGFPVGGAHCIAVSLAYETEVLGLFDLLEMASVPALRSERTAAHPPLIVGGPITMSNALPLAPIADAVVMGDGEPVMADLTEALVESHRRGSKRQLLERLAGLPGLFVPQIHGTAVPDMLLADARHLPAVGHIWTPDAELGDMLLIETSRGCPRFCAFCVMRSTAQPVRVAPVEAVEAAMDASDAPRFGFVGAAVSEYAHIRRVLRHAVDRGKGVGVSSLRADRLDDELVGLLRAGGVRTMTIASDAASQKLRSRLKKGLRTRHLLAAAHLAAAHNMPVLKVYVIVGLPGEQDSDMEELAALALDLRKIVPRVALGLSPFVPKLHTPLGDAPFEALAVTNARIAALRRRLRGRVELRSVSSKWAWVEYRLSQGGPASGLAAHAAWRRGGRYADFKRAFGELEEDERFALQAAREHALWRPSGMR